MERRPLNSQDILDRLYGVRRPKRASLLKRTWRDITIWVEDHNWRLILASFAIFAWLLGHIYYYNQLTTLEFDVLAAQAQIQVVQEKRSHIQRNLVRIVQHYEGYERGVMTEVTEMRTDAQIPTDPLQPPPPTATGAGDGAPLEAEASLGDLMIRLNAVAEQYPNLHLSVLAQRFSDAIIQTETEIAQSVMKFNDAVNMYTTVLHQFPGVLFGKTAGFDSYDFYAPEDLERLRYHEVDL